MDDLVDVVEGHEVALEDVRAGLGLLEVKAGATGDNLDLVLDVVLQDLAQGEALGHAVDKRQVVDAKGGLELRELVQVVEHDLRDDVLLELNDQADALLVGLVAHVGDALDALLVYQLGNLLLQGALVDLVRDLGEHQAAAAGLGGLHVGLGTHGDGAAAGLVGLADAVGAHDDGAGREVRARHDGHELICGGVRVVDEHARGLDGLAQVVRRDVCGHADGDARGAVDQQVGEARGQDLRLLEGLVVVGLPVHGVLLQVAQQLHGGLGQAGLGVTHCGGAVAVDVAEVAVTVHQRGADGEPLGQADHGLVDGGVTVRVVLADDLADRPRTLLVRAVGEDAGLVHGVQDAPVDGLQAVAHVRQGARRDDGHGVLDERLAHLVAELGDLQGAAMLVRLAGVHAAAAVAELLLELAVVVIFLGVLTLDVGVVDVLAGVVGLGTVQKPPQVLGKLLVGAAVVDVVVCHVRPFSRWRFCWREERALLARKVRGCAARPSVTRQGSARRGRGARCTRGGTPPGCP